MHQENAIIVEVRPDKKVFRNFALFDTFVLKKRWVRPVVFLAIMSAFAIAALVYGKNQAGLLGGVLLAVGIGLPAAYVLSFLLQVNDQAEKNRLYAGRRIYTVTLREDGVSVHHEQRKNETLGLNWADISAYRRKDCIYLYAGQTRAFLLPAGQANVSDDELWSFITSHKGS